MKKAVVFFAVTLLSASVLSPQNLVEAAKKEKERRESLKGKTAVVVTNADLAKVKKQQALVAPVLPAESLLPPSAGSAGEIQEAAGQTPPAVSTLSSQELLAEAQKKVEEKRAELETKWTAAKERVELLTLKMTALQQQLYSFNSMVSKDSIQQQINETYQKLQDAQAEEAKAKDELDKFSAANIK
jgi:hypothetical protein